MDDVRSSLSASLAREAPTQALALRAANPIALDSKNAAFIGFMNAATSPQPDSGPLMETEEIASIVGRCVSCVAEDLASCPVELVDVTDPKAEKLVEDHELLRLFEHVNVSATWTPGLYWQHVVADLMLEGNSFTWLDLKGGRPSNLVRLRPQMVHVRPDPAKYIGGYTLVTEHLDEVHYKADEIFHVRTRNQSSPYRGLGNIARLRQSILLTREMENFQYYRFKNGLPVGLILETNRTFNNEAELQQVSDDVRERFGGSKNAGKPMIVQAGEVKATVIPRPTENEIGFLESMKFTRGDIAMMFGVPPCRVGDWSAPSQLGSNGAEEQIKSYWADTIGTWQRLIVDFVNYGLIPRFWPSQTKLRLRFKTDHVRALQKSEQEIADSNTKGTDGGWMTANEARKRFGLDAYKDPAADKLYIHGRELGADPLADLKAAADGAFGGKPGDNQDPKDPKEKSEDKPQDPKKKLHLVRAIPSNLLDDGDEAARIQRKVRIIFAEMYRIAGEQHLELSKVPGGGAGFNVTDANVLRFVEKQSIRVSQHVVATTHDFIRLAIGEGIKDGLGISAMRDLVQAAFAERREDWQLDRIARTETHQAQEGGSFLVAQQNGIENKAWISSRDDKVRGWDANDEHDHRGLEGQIVPMDGYFVDPRSGARLLYPGDGDAPPGAIINCRCTWVSDFSHLRGWEVPDYDHVWLRKTATLATLESVLRTFFSRAISDMEDRALASFDQQTAEAA